MALIKCSECEKEISDKAVSCPSCGNPINSPMVQIANKTGQNIHIEPELTSKKWKRIKLISWGGVLISFFLLISSKDADFNNPTYLGGSALLFFCLIILVVAYIGAWYSDKRTR